MQLITVDVGAKREFGRRMTDVLTYLADRTNRKAAVQRHLGLSGPRQSRDSIKILWIGIKSLATTR